MKMIRFAKISILLGGILVFLGFTVPIGAQTLTPITLQLTNANPSVKVDVCSGAGDWSVSYFVTGRVNSLSFDIKNDGVGAADFCWGTSVRKPKSGIQKSETAENIPVAEPSACGEEFLPDQNGIPLSFKAYYQTGDANAVVDITVFPPPRSVDDPPCP